MRHKLHIGLGLICNVCLIGVGQRLHVIVDLSGVEPIGPRQHPGGILAGDLAGRVGIVIFAVHPCRVGINTQIHRQIRRFLVCDLILNTPIHTVLGHVLPEGQSCDLQCISAKLRPLDRLAVIFIEGVPCQAQGQGIFHVLLGPGGDSKLAAVRCCPLCGFGQVCAGVGLLPLRHVNGYSVAALGELDFSCLVHGVRL